MCLEQRRMFTVSWCVCLELNCVTFPNPANNSMIYYSLQLHFIVPSFSTHSNTPMQSCISGWRHMTADYAGTSKAHQREWLRWGERKARQEMRLSQTRVKEAATGRACFEKSDHNTAAGVHRLTGPWTNHSSERGCSCYSGVYESFSWTAEHKKGV